MVMTKKIFRGSVPYLVVFALLFSFFSIGAMLGSGHAFAADDYVDKSQIGGGTGNITDITTTLKDWILTLRIIGAVVAVFGIVIGGILFSISLGNAQRRGIAIACLIGAAIGIVIIGKAPTLADYFINQSAT
ncbi:hypothetical protein [Cohnella sp. AR92]|uniref:hypothetical protein n=1 Tax=Cohnella sp. AR92 TaxID=648716 RepID=UPI000F8D528F|nr:hypothetical protein [Cohnella sp. AR92]RUS44984.1 hypothetical protein ELR57_22275 [Cohnella sp. AR92]